METITRTTTTEQPVLRLTLHQLPELENEFDEQINKLTEIYLKYTNWNDFLSRRISRWIAKVMALDVNETFDSEALLRTEIDRRIKKLTTRVLVNPLTQNPLKNPQLVGEWVWEKATLEDYLKLMPNEPKSPFHGGPIEEATDHLYAKEMIAFIKEIAASNIASREVFLPQNSRPTILDLQVALPTATPGAHNVDAVAAQFARLKRELDNNKLATYLMLAKAAKTIEESYWKRKEQKAGIKLDELLREESRQYTESLVAAEAAKQSEHTKELTEKLNRIEITCKETVESRDRCIEVVEGRCKTLETSLDNKEAENKRHEAEIHYLRASYQAKVLECRDLQNQAGRRGGCVIL